MEEFLSKVDAVHDIVGAMARGEEVDVDDQTIAELEGSSASSSSHTKFNSTSINTSSPTPHDSAGMLEAMAADAKERGERKKRQRGKGLAWKEKGNKAYCMGDLDGALCAYDKGLAEAPDMLVFHANKARVYLDLQDWDAAVDSASTLLRFREHTVPSLVAKAVFRKAQGLEGLGREEEALAVLIDADQQGVVDLKNARQTYKAKLEKSIARARKVEEIEEKAGDGEAASHIDAALLQLRRAGVELLPVAAALAELKPVLEKEGPEGAVLFGQRDGIELIGSLVKMGIAQPQCAAVLAVVGNADDDLRGDVLDDVDLVHAILGCCADNDSDEDLEGLAAFVDMARSSPEGAHQVLGDARVYEALVVANWDWGRGLKLTAELVELPYRPLLHDPIVEWIILTCLDVLGSDGGEGVDEVGREGALGMMANVARIESAMGVFESEKERMAELVLFPAWASGSESDPNTLLLVGRIAGSPWMRDVLAPRGEHLVSLYLQSVRDGSDARKHLVRVLAGMGPDSVPFLVDQNGVLPLLSELRDQLDTQDLVYAGNSLLLFTHVLGDPSVVALMKPGVADLLVGWMDVGGSSNVLAKNAAIAAAKCARNEAVLHRLRALRALERMAALV